MISIEEAILAVKKNSSKISKAINIPIVKAGNSTLFSDVYSPIDMPPFRQSAMDGYALNLHDNFTYSFIGEVKAGDGHHIQLNKGEAVRIFTGAAVPDSANAVIMQEKVSVAENTIIIETKLPINYNIRAIGEQVEKGEFPNTRRIFSVMRCNHCTDAPCVDESTGLRKAHIEKLLALGEEWSLVAEERLRRREVHDEIIAFDLTEVGVQGRGKLVRTVRLPEHVDTGACSSPILESVEITRRVGKEVERLT